MTTSSPPDPVSRLKAFWNSRYAKAGDGFVYGTAPNTFLAASAGALPPGGTVLCIADGEGRNSVWLAKQGFTVGAIDVAEQGVAKARALAAREGVSVDASVADVTRFDYGTARYDAVVSIFLHLPAKARRATHRRIVEALKPGGVFVYEAYGPDQLAYGTGGPPEQALLHPLDDVLADLEGCAIEHAFCGARTVQEGDAHHGEGQVVQVIARKIEPSNASPTPR
ncbi:MAG: class I SAM-dependent methyltransferase [Burkholderiales bacterium]|nr:class I SAM-dependent methyltransferase [Burkholderiales bacterium]